MTPPFEVTTDVACRIVGINQFRLNEHVAAGRFPCMPATARGRYRVFSIDDLVALWLFRSILDKTQKAKDAGHFACRIANLASANPEAQLISVVQTTSGNRSVHLTKDVPDSSDWAKVDFPMRGMTVQDVTTYNIELIRDEIISRAKEELESGK